MKFLGFAIGFIAALGVVSAAPKPNKVAREIAAPPTGIPQGNGRLILLDTAGNQVACIGYFGNIEALGSPTCGLFTAAESANKTAAFDSENGRGPCTFFPFTDNSYNYTCSGESIAPDYYLSTFTVSIVDLIV